MSRKEQTRIVLTGSIKELDRTLLGKGLTTQMESTASPVWLKVARVPSRIELMSIP